jgi:hypothetical protein
MNQNLINEALRIANEMATNRGLQIDEGALTKALIAVIGEREGQDEPHEIAENALELLGKGPGPSTSRRGRRPF